MASNAQAGDVRDSGRDSVWSGTQYRYLVYCLAHGASSPDEMWEKDAHSMGEYIRWNGEQWRQWRIETGWSGAGYTEEDHKNFDLWLGHRFGVATPTTEAKA